MATTHPDDELWAADAAAPAGAVEEAAPVSPWRRFWDFLRGPYPTLVSRLGLGGIFLLAGLTKLGVPASFADDIRAYELPLPDPLVQIMAVGLPPLEVGLGVWLLAGLFTRFAAAISGGLMAIFLIAISQAAARGLDINCGCVPGPQGTSGPTANAFGLALVQALGPLGTYLTTEKVGWESIIRDTIFLLMAIHLVVVPTTLGIDSWRRARHQAAEAEAAEDETED